MAHQPKHTVRLRFDTHHTFVTENRYTEEQAREITRIVEEASKAAIEQGAELVNLSFRFR